MLTSSLNLALSTSAETQSSLFSTRPGSNDLLPLPAFGFQMFQSAAGTWLGHILVLNHERVGILFLIEVAKGMMDLSVLG